MRRSSRVRPAHERLRADHRAIIVARREFANRLRLSALPRARILPFMGAAIMRDARWLAVVAALLLTGCSVISIDLRPRIRPLEEETVQGRGSAKILLLDLSGVLSDEGPSFSLNPEAPRVPLLARVQEELTKAEEDDHVKALVVRINSPGG